MSVNQLNDRMLSLQNEKLMLEADQGSSQNPSVNKNILERLAEVNAELSAVQRALAVVVGLGAISSLSSDDYNDNIPPVITINGDNPATVELGDHTQTQVHQHLMHFMVQHQFHHLVQLIPVL